MLIMEFFLKEGRNPHGPTNQRQTTTDILVYFPRVPFLCKVFLHSCEHSVYKILYFILLPYHNNCSLLQKFLSIII